MKRTKVTGSSLIKSIGYDESTMELDVELATNKVVYTFTDVSETIYNKFMAAESKGQFFNTHIKNIFENAA